MFIKIEKDFDKSPNFELQQKMSTIQITSSEHKDKLHNLKLEGYRREYLIEKLGSW